MRPSTKETRANSPLYVGIGPGAVGLVDVDAHAAAVERLRDMFTDDSVAAVHFRLELRMGERAVRMRFKERAEVETGRRAWVYLQVLPLQWSSLCHLKLHPGGLPADLPADGHWPGGGSGDQGVVKQKESRDAPPGSVPADRCCWPPQRSRVRMVVDIVDPQPRWQR